MLSSLTLGLLLAAPAPSLNQVETLPALTQVSSPSSGFRGNFNQRVARIRADLAVRGSVELQALRNLAHDLAVNAEPADLESMWLELILLAESVAHQRSDQKMAMRWLDPSDPEHPVVAGQKVMRTDRIALLNETQKQVAGRSELKARLAHWGSMEEPEPLFSFDQAWERTTRVYGTYEGSLPKLNGLLEHGSPSTFDLRDAPGLYYLVLEGLGRDRNWKGQSPLVALFQVDATTAESLVEELLFCGYPEWTRQLLDLWLGKHVEPWRSRLRANLMAGLLDDPLGRRAVLPQLNENLEKGQYSAPLVKRLQILMNEDTAVMEAVYGSNHGIMPANNSHSFYPELVPLAVLAVDSASTNVRRNAARDLSQTPDPMPFWVNVDASDSELHTVFVESLIAKDLGARKHSLEPRGGRQTVMVERSAADLSAQPVLRKRLPEIIAAMSSSDLAWSLKTLAKNQKDTQLALQALNATVVRDDFQEWTAAFNQTFSKLVARGHIPSIELASKRFGPTVDKNFKDFDFEFVLESLVTNGDPQSMAWAVALVRHHNVEFNSPQVIEDLIRFEHSDPDFLKHVVALSSNLVDDGKDPDSLFFQLEGTPGNAMRKIAFADGLAPEERIVAWCMGWDAQVSPAQFMALTQLPDMQAAFQGNFIATTLQLSSRTRKSSRASKEAFERFQASLRFISQWYWDGRYCTASDRAFFHKALLEAFDAADPRVLELVRWHEDGEFGPQLSQATLARLLAAEYEDDVAAMYGDDLAEMSLINLRRQAPHLLTNDLIVSLLRDPFTVGAMVNELVKTGSREGLLQPLADLLRDNSPIAKMRYISDSAQNRIRMQVVQLIERFNSLEAAQALLGFDQFQNTEIASEVDAALSRMHERFATREAFANWDSQQRQRATTLASLAALLESESSEQRVAAVQSLGSLAAQEYLPDLIALFEDEDPRVADEARVAFHSIQKALIQQTELSSQDATDKQTASDSEQG